MAEQNKPVVPVPAPPHDRVASLSLRSDGSIDQNNPELIGDKDDALAATKKQFAEFAVSAVDQQARIDAGLASVDEEVTEDAAIAAVKAEHDKAAAAAEKAAESVVNALHGGNAAPEPAKPAAKSSTEK